MRLGVPKESLAGECRVAATPESVQRLLKIGFTVQIERGAGAASSYPDSAYEAAGAELVDNAWDGAAVIVKVNAPNDDEIARFEPGTSLVSLIFPAQNKELVDKLAERKITVLGLDAVPRISRAQKMDVLSSMANIAGYRAVIEASHHFPGFFNGQITAAGKAPPAHVLVIGAGVAGLAAIGAARGLGARVSAFDVRPAVREQVESMGAKFLEVKIEESGEGSGGYAKVMSQEFIDAEMALFREQAPKTNVVITTALIPGRPAPKLWLQDMVELMPTGGVVVDLAAAAGGNCDCTVAGQVVKHGDVTVIGYTDLTSRLPKVASQFFATNIFHLLDEIGAEWTLDHDDEAIRGALILEQGELLWPPPKKEPPPPPPKVEPEPVVVAAPAAVAKAPAKSMAGSIGNVLLAGILTAVAVWAPTDFIQHFTVFVLACFVGWQLIWNVSHALHTPLMSVTNAISGIILVGGMIQAGSGNMDLAGALGAVAILFASINVVGGFLVTHRMLQMFRKA